MKFYINLYKNSQNKVQITLLNGSWNVGEVGEPQGIVANLKWQLFFDKCVLLGNFLNIGSFCLKF